MVRYISSYGLSGTKHISYYSERHARAARFWARHDITPFIADWEDIRI